MNIVTMPTVDMDLTIYMKTTIKKVEADQRGLKRWKVSITLDTGRGNYMTERGRVLAHSITLPHPITIEVDPDPEMFAALIEPLLRWEMDQTRVSFLFKDDLTLALLQAGGVTVPLPTKAVIESLAR